MARRMPGLGTEAYRGVIVYEHDGFTEVEICGPYNKPGHARSAMTQELKKWVWRYRIVLDTFVERSTISWERLDD